jgi:hypothetical protein
LRKCDITKQKFIITSNFLQTSGVLQNSARYINHGSGNNKRRTTKRKMSAYGSIGKRFQIIQKIFCCCRTNHAIDKKSYQQENENKNKPFDKFHS